MTIVLREILFSDYSRGRYLVIYNGENVLPARVKITLKQWKQFKKLGFAEGKIYSNEKNA